MPEPLNPSIISSDSGITDTHTETGQTDKDINPPLVEIENESPTTHTESIQTDALGRISVGNHIPKTVAPSTPLPTLQEVTSSAEDYIIQGKILSQLATQLKTIRVIFLIVATTYFLARMLVVSGIIPLEFARWVHTLEPALFLATSAYIAIWCGFVCTGASLRFGFKRYVFYAISGISTLIFSIWWSDIFPLF